MQLRAVKYLRHAMVQIEWRKPGWKMKYSVLMLLACLAPAAHAQSFDTESTQGKWLVADAGKQARVSLSEATERVQKSTGGRVLSAQAVHEEGRDLYRIKVLTPQGEVRVVYVNPATGGLE
jgi:uncharacterized membrane protein YkoI